ncbi:MAG: hypothetical protein ACKOCM_01950 [Cyanobacteriota bacterium]
MAPLEDRAYTQVCSRLATLLSISIAAARRKVELAAVREGIRDRDGKVAVAERLIEATSSSGESHGALLDGLLEAVASEMNFMDED